MSAAIDFLTTLAGCLQTQDNCYTASPNYCIQENRLFCGIDEDYGGQVGWFDDGATHPAEGKKHAALERYYRLFDKEPSNWTRCSYEFKWRYTGISFLTHDAAHAYAKDCRHRHTYDLRVYVDSHYRNHEMREVRRLLAGPIQECIAQLEAMLQEDDGGMQAQYAKAALAALDTATEPHQ